ncbi:Uncharacterised protein [Fluoribacter dumoffii]|uniref:Uncharacterized protein n=1 Tax=Fluoribacter dumoffii TaxID=463 RepID=A0A377G6C7_9GAMM|nr:Uncharacterised protein [Fluoribacter dumoffii]
MVMIDTLESSLAGVKKGCSHRRFDIMYTGLSTDFVDKQLHLN